MKNKRLWQKIGLHVSCTSLKIQDIFFVCYRFLILLKQIDIFVKHVIKTNKI